MTFLELCQRLVHEAGITGGGPTAVTGQTGEMLNVVNWILTAYQQIQNKHRKRWDFLRADFSFNTVAGTSTYAPTDAGVNLPELETWEDEGMRIYLTATGTDDEQWLQLISSWPQFKATYLFGANRNVSDRPYRFAIKPDKSLIFWPKPDDIFTVTGEYFKRAQTMTANGDEPLFPEEFHMAIVWKALMLYGAYESAAECYSHGMTEYKAVMGELELDQLPRPTLGGPLV